MTAGDKADGFKIVRDVDGKWPFHPNVEDLRELQRRLDELDTHIVWFGPRTFVLAHTDEERANFSSLEECELHRELADLSEAPVEKLGYYRATKHIPDAYSESYRGDAIGWDFDPVEVPE